MFTNTGNTSVSLPHFHSEGVDFTNSQSDILDESRYDNQDYGTLVHFIAESQFSFKGKEIHITVCWSIYLESIIFTFRNIFNVCLKFVKVKLKF